jgi:hypothetical protein
MADVNDPGLMSGLLGFLKTPEGQGLLAAGFGGLASANSRTPINSLGKAGLAGMVGYSNALDNQRQQDLSNLQTQKLKTDLATTQRQQDAINSYAANLPADQKQAFMLSPDKFLESQQVFQKPQFVETYDDKGRKVKGWVGANGFQQVGGSEAMPVKWQDAGGQLVALDPLTGLPTGAGLAKTMSAAEKDASSRGWAGVDLQRQQLSKPTFNETAGGFVYPPSQINPRGSIVTPQGMTNPKEQAAITAQQALDQANTVYSHPGRAAGTGFSSFTSAIPGTDAKGFQAQLDTLKAQTFLPMVASLKGMGALSDAEGKKLSDAVGALDPRMPEKEFESSLKNVTNQLYLKSRAAGLNVTLPDFADMTKQNSQSAPAKKSIFSSGGWSASVVK